MYIFEIRPYSSCYFIKSFLKLAPEIIRSLYVRLKKFVQVAVRKQTERNRVFLRVAPCKDSAIRKILIVELIRNTGLWNPDYSSSNTESHQRMESGIQVPLTKTVRNPVPSIWNPRVEFRIQECLGFPHTGEQEANKWFFVELFSGKEGYIPPRAYFLIRLSILSREQLLPTPCQAVTK